MKNSHKFFENRECEYYPCHEGLEEINCTFSHHPEHYEIVMEVLKRNL